MTIQPTHPYARQPNSRNQLFLHKRQEKPHTVLPSHVKCKCNASHFISHISNIMHVRPSIRHQWPCPSKTGHNPLDELIEPFMSLYQPTSTPEASASRIPT